MYISCEFEFQAAHYLPYVPDGHKCKRLHGHSYRVEIGVVGEVNERSGMVIDFAEIKSAFSPLMLNELDHRSLNDILVNPTAENLAAWIWSNVEQLISVSAVTVWETRTSKVVYNGPLSN